MPPLIQPKHSSVRTNVGQRLTTAQTEFCTPSCTESGPIERREVLHLRLLQIHLFVIEKGKPAISDLLSQYAIGSSSSDLAREER
jgi:hypothetical protein